MKVSTGIDIIWIILSVVEVVGIFSTIISAAPSEIFIQGVVRNSTTNNLTTALRDINITLINGSTPIYSQVQAGQATDNGVYHTTFTTIMHDWFLWPLEFVIKVGNDEFTQTEIVPVPIAHAAYIANNSYYVGGHSSAEFVTDSASASWDRSAADDYNEGNLTAQTSGWDKNSADDYATSDFNTDLANSGIRTSITNNITSVNNSMRPYVISTNASMKSYVDNNFIGSGGLWNLLNFTSALTATGLQASVTQNITSHAATFKHGNTTAEIRAQFVGGSNISIVNGVISVNGSFGTGSITIDNTLINLSRLDNATIIRADNTTWVMTIIDVLFTDYFFLYYNASGNWNLVNYTRAFLNSNITELKRVTDWSLYYSNDEGITTLPFNTQTGKYLKSNGADVLTWDTPSAIDYSKVQNFTNTNCSAGEYAFGRNQNGSWYCRADQSGASDIDNTLINASRLDNATIIRNTNTSWVSSLVGGAYNLANFTANYATTGYWQLANFSTAFTNSGAWIKANQTTWYQDNGYTTVNFTADYSSINSTIIKNSNTSWVLAQLGGNWLLANTTAWYNSNGYKKANLTLDYPNLDTDSTNDLSLATLDNGSVIRNINQSWVLAQLGGNWILANATAWYNSNGYKKANLTLDYPNLDTDSTNDLSLATLDNGSIIRNINTSWWNALYALTGAWNKANFTSAFTNSGAYQSANFTSDLTATGLQASVAKNITAHEATFKHGNTTAEIRAQFTGSTNISIVNGVISVNGSFGTGSATVDYSKVQNFTNSNCSAGEYVFGRQQNGSWFCRADQSGGAGGSDIWLDGGTYAYLNQTVATTINTTINYTQILTCKEGEYLTTINGSYYEFRSTPDKDYGIRFNFLSGTYTADGDHYAVQFINSTRGFSRGVQIFDISSVASQGINKATYRLYTDTHVDPSKKGYVNIYYNYEFPTITFSDCNGNKELCYNYTKNYTFLYAWKDIMFYADQTGKSFSGVNPAYIDIDISDIITDAIAAGNTTISMGLRLDTDTGENITIEPLFGKFYSFTENWWPALHFTSSIATGETPGSNNDRFPGSKIMVWTSTPNELKTQCVNEPSIIKYGDSTPVPRIDLSIIAQRLNISGIAINCSNIIFDSGLGSSTICDGTDATGASDIDNTLINASRLDNATIIRNTNTSWVSSLVGGAYNLANFTANYATTGYWQLANFSTAFTNSGAWIKANQTAWYTSNGWSITNHTAANSGNWMLANTTAWYNSNGWSRANETYNTTNQMIIAVNTTGYFQHKIDYANILNPTWVQNKTDTNFTRTCWGPFCTFYNYTMGALVTQVT